jgi:hypothetical protein
VPVRLSDFSEAISNQRVRRALTAALTTSMAMFMLLRMRMNGLVKAGLFTALLVGLLSFGGRAAIGTTLIILGVVALVVLVRGVARRDLSLVSVGAIMAALVIVPLLMLVLVTSTDIGARIPTHMYMDDSADVRTMQWVALDHLNLYGVPPDRLGVLKYQIGLGSDTTGIENFWLLMFVSLGFVVFVISLGMFIVHLGRTAGHPLGRMLMPGAILIDSISNSLGRKSVDLLFMAACMIAMAGYLRTAPAVSLQRRALTTLRRTSARLVARPSHANLAGFKS